jgi:prophage endopeptidase
MNQIIIALAILLAGFGAGWESNGWRMGNQVASLKQQHAETITAATQANNTALVLAIKRNDLMVASLSTQNDAALAKLKKAQNENNSLRDSVRGGAFGLRIAATCAPSNPGNAQSGTGPGVDSGASAELADSARPAYFALRDAIATVQNQLGACQGELRTRTSP